MPPCKSAGHEAVFERLTLMTGLAPAVVVQSGHVTPAAVAMLMTMHLTTAAIAVGALSTRAVGGR